MTLARKRSTMTRALVVHPGTQHVFYLATELNRLGALTGLHTGFAAGHGSVLEGVIKSSAFPFRRRLSNRLAMGVPVGLLQLQIGLELAWQVRRFVSGEGQALYHWRNERFQHSVPERALAEADVVIGFDTSAWVLVERCRSLGRPLIVIRTIGHPDAMEAVSAELADRFPGWEPTFERRLGEVRRAEQIEHDGANLIVASSSFTRQTLVDHGVDAGKIRVIPHGVDLERFAPALPSRGRPFRFVFVGSISSRKGVPLLMRAWQRLAPTQAELWLVGPVEHRVRRLLPDLPGLKILGEVPGATVPEVLRQCDVFVFPSYFEGFGLVILQAMACGLPVITTTATAGPDLITGPGVGGWVIPTGSEERLVEAMAHCLANPDDMHAVGQLGRSIAERYSWQAYGRNWMPVLEEAVSCRAARAGQFKPKLPMPTFATLQPQVLLAHPGTQYSYQLAKELQRLGRLAAFHTSIAIRSRSNLARSINALPRFARHRVANRILDGMPGDKLRVHPFAELLSLLKQQFEGGASEANLHARNAHFQNAIPQQVFETVRAVIGFDTSSWILAERCRQAGVSFVLDQSIGHPDSKTAIYKRIRDEFPHWDTSIEARRPEVRRAEQIEHDLADLVVAASSFTVRTLVENGVAAEKIRVNPYGVDIRRFTNKQTEGKHPLRFVFVGSVTARKGVPLLLKAWRLLRPGSGELWLIGPIANHLRPLLPSQQGLRIIGAVPQIELPSLLQQCDVLVFPSYFEGFGLVIPEAMACGLPVIATDATAAPDIYSEGEGGWIVPVGNVESLAARLDHCLSDPVRTRAQGHVARRIAEKQTWGGYGDRWASILDGLPMMQP